jgi:hypothetical protein
VSPYEARVDTVHAGQEGLRILLEYAQGRRAPSATQVDAQASVPGESVSDPVGTGSVLDYDEDPAAVVEVSDRNAASRAGPPAECLDHEGVLARIGRPGHSDEDREGRDRVRDPDHGSGKSHEFPPRRSS